MRESDYTFHPTPLAFIRSKKQKTLQTVAWGPFPAGFRTYLGCRDLAVHLFEAGVGEPWILAWAEPEQAWERQVAWPASGHRLSGRGGGGRCMRSEAGAQQAGVAGAALGAQPALRGWPARTVPVPFLVHRQRREARDQPRCLTLGRRLTVSD